MCCECEHVWEDWEKILWYTPKGRFVGEARKCKNCTAVQTQDLEVDTRPRVIQPTIGVFAGIFNKEGKILLKQITSGKFKGEWDLPGGGVDAERASQAPDERIFWEELIRHVKDEVGISISLSPNSRILMPAVLKGGGDWAFPVMIGFLFENPTKGVCKYFSLEEVQELARGAEGNRLLNGEGKRMHRLVLSLFHLSSVLLT